MRKHPPAILVSFLVLLLLSFPLILARTASAATAPDPQVQKLVDELRTVTAKARKERSADPWLLQALDEMAQRHYWPWRRVVAEESFADGDYAKNPVWEVAAGNFWVDKTLGLRSRASAPAAAPANTDKSQDKKKFKDALKEAVLAEMAGQKPGAAPATTAAPVSATEIYLPARIGNAFVLDTGFTQHQAPSEAGRIEFGLFEGTRRDRGYILAISTGKENIAELLRVSATGSAVIERKPLPVAIATGESQTISWRRDPEGGMLVLLNDKTLIQTSDRGLGAAFKSLGITNRAGDFAIKQVKLADAG